MHICTQKWPVYAVYTLSAGMRAVIWAHWSNSWHILACIYLSLWERGRRHENILLWWQEVVFSLWESAGSDGFSYGSRSRWLCGVDSQTLPCQGALLCPDILTPMLLLWLTWSVAQKVVFFWLLCSAVEENVVEAALHSKVKNSWFFFTNARFLEPFIQNTSVAKIWWNSLKRWRTRTPLPLMGGCDFWWLHLYLNPFGKANFLHPASMPTMQCFAFCVGQSTILCAPVRWFLKCILNNGSVILNGL